VPLTKGDFYYTYAHARAALDRGFSVGGAAEIGLDELRELHGNPKRMPNGISALERRLFAALRVAKRRHISGRSRKSTNGVTGDLTNKVDPWARYAIRMEVIAYIEVIEQVEKQVGGHRYPDHWVFFVEFSERLHCLPTFEDDGDYKDQLLVVTLYLNRYWRPNICALGLAIIDGSIVLNVLGSAKAVPGAVRTVAASWIGIAGEGLDAVPTEVRGLLCQVPDGTWIKMPVGERGWPQCHARMERAIRNHKKQFNQRSTDRGESRDCQTNAVQ